MKEKNKEYSIGLLIFLILSATLISVLIVKFLNFYIPESSKFDVEIWGTVSDWYTYLASAVGIAFIVKTLQSQRKVQEDQNSLKIIEEIKFRKTIMPTLFKNEETFFYHYNKSSNKYNIDFTLTFEKNLAKNIFIYSDDELKISTLNARIFIMDTSNSNKNVNKKYSYEIWSIVNPNVSLNISFLLEKKENTLGTPTFNRNIFLTYSDENDYEYQQYIHIYEGNEKKMNIEYSSVKYI